MLSNKAVYIRELEAQKFYQYKANVVSDIVLHFVIKMTWWYHVPFLSWYSFYGFIILRKWTLLANRRFTIINYLRIGRIL